MQASTRRKNAQKEREQKVGGGRGQERKRAGGGERVQRSERTAHVRERMASDTESGGERGKAVETLRKVQALYSWIVRMPLDAFGFLGSQ